MPEFEFVDSERILNDSFALGRKIYETGFIPTHAVSLWRGGTPVGLGVGEYFRLKGHFINHTTFATASYTGVNSQSEIIIKGLEHLIKVIAKEDKLLIIDDIYDSGNTIEAVIEAINNTARANSPEKIKVACIHYKKKKRSFHRDVLTLRDIDEGIWLNYPHEISDLYMESDPNENILKDKSQEQYDIINNKTSFKPINMQIADDYLVIKPNELMDDALKLAANIYNDGFIPDFIIATWPGGVNSGLPIHEFFKYRIKKENRTSSFPDHIAINTSMSHFSYKTNIIGMRYLEENINNTDKVLLIDTSFQSGRRINQTVDKLKSLLRRNISIDNLRIASVYYHEKSDATWTTTPSFSKPHYYLKKTNKPVIFPHQVHRLKRPELELPGINKELSDIIFS